MPFETIDEAKLIIDKLENKIKDLEQELIESLRPIRTRPTDRNCITHRFILYNTFFKGDTHWAELDYKDPKNLNSHNLEPFKK